MPELPDLSLYCEAIEAHYAGQAVQRVRVASPFVVRTHEPPLAELSGKKLLRMSRIGKRLVFHFEHELYAVLHLMIAGRLRQKPAGTAVPKKVGLLAIDFEQSCLLLTEASPKKRASLHLVRGADNLAEFDVGGLEPLTATLGQFEERLRSENHTLKRSLTDPHLFAAIGNAYSDEILHHAQLSPVLLSQKLSHEQAARLYQSTQHVLQLWVERLRVQAAGRFPDKVTAFHEGMAAHGKFGKACPACGEPIQRIRRADNEANYCPRCQTGGKLLADRSLSRLLHDDWPATPEELEEQKRERRDKLQGP